MSLTDSSARSSSRMLCMVGVICVMLMGISTQAMAQQSEGGVEESERVFSSQRRILFVPTLALNVGFSTQFRPGAETRKNTHVSVAGGLAGNMVINESIMGFVSGNLEIEQHELSDGREVTYFMPMMHAGVSFTGCYDEPAGVLTAMFPCAKIYGLAGMRPAPAGRPAAMRLGVGISSVWVPFVALSAGGVLPSSYETLMEVDPLGNRLYMFRIGLGF